MRIWNPIRLFGCQVCGAVGLQEVEGVSSYVLAVCPACGQHERFERPEETISELRHTAHIALWTWLANNPSKYKSDWPGWSYYPAQPNDCFACAEAKDRGAKLNSGSTDCADLCPLRKGCWDSWNMWRNLSHRNYSNCHSSALVMAHLRWDHRPLKSETKSQSGDRGGDRVKPLNGKTVEEAKELTCPMTMNGIERAYKCEGPDCNAWVWINHCKACDLNESSTSCKERQLYAECVPFTTPTYGRCGLLTVHS